MKFSTLVKLSIIITYTLCSCNNDESGQNTTSSTRTIRSPSNVVTTSVIPDSLNKYSYQVFGSYKGQYTSGGTCSFFKIGKDIYILSNYHVFTGYDPEKQIKLFDLDTLRVWDPNTTTFFAIRFDTNLIMRQLLNKADFTVIKVNWKANFNLINKLFDRSFFHKEPVGFYFFGYPTREGLQNQRYGFCTEGPYIKDITPYIGIWPLTEIQKREVIAYRSKYFYLIPSEGREGMSGSPVFGKFPFSQNGSLVYKYRFMGIFSEAAAKYKISFALKAKVIFAR